MSYLRKPLEKLFQTPGHVSVLRVLFPLKEGISGREISRRAKMNDRNCRLVLQRLEVIGVVSYQGSGKVRLYSVNREHYMANKFLSPLFESERGMINAIVETIKIELNGASVWAALFGSAARTTDTVESDLHLIVLVKGEQARESAAHRTDKLQAKLQRKFGITLSPIIMTLREWRSGDRSFMDTKKEILSDHITIAGDERVAK